MVPKACEVRGSSSNTPFLSPKCCPPTQIDKFQLQNAVKSLRNDCRSKRNNNCTRKKKAKISKTNSRPSWEPFCARCSCVYTCHYFFGSASYKEFNHLYAKCQGQAARQLAKLDRSTQSEKARKGLGHGTAALSKEVQSFKKITSCGQMPSTEAATGGSGSIRSP